MKGIGLYLLAVSLTVLFACKKGGDNNTGNAYLQCPSDTSLVRASWNYGTIVFPTAFTPNGDGRNDILRVVANDPRVMRFMRFRITDANGTTVQTLYNTDDYWTGYNSATSSNYPAGMYRVDYDVTMHGGSGADSLFSGHTCIKLYNSGPGGCLIRQGDTTQDLFEDQLDISTLNTVRPTAESFCP
jgi:hypothetical protein